MAPPDDAVEGYLEISPRLTRVNGQTSPLLAAAAFLGFGGWRAGGAGLFLLEEVRVEDSPLIRELELRLGYGGLVIERATPLNDAEGARALAWTTRLLVGAGHAELTNSVTGFRFRSDNFLLLEPTVSIETTLTGRLTTGAVAGYRLVIGADGLDNIEGSDLGGPSVGVLVRIGPF